MLWIIYMIWVLFVITLGIIEYITKNGICLSLLFISTIVMFYVPFII